MYATKKLADGEEYFHPPAQVEHSSTGSMTDCYVPAQKMKSGEKFHPVDKNGNEISHFLCTFRKQGSYALTARDNGRIKTPRSDYKDEILFKPKVSIPKGARKGEVNPRLTDAFRTSARDIQGDFDGILADIGAQKTAFQSEMRTPFVPESVRNIALKAIDDQLQEVRQQRTDCDRLVDLIGNDSE